MNKGTRSENRSFLSSGARSTLIQGAGILASTVLSIVLARALGAEQFGVYGFQVSLVMLLSIPVQFGLPSLIVRETARLREHGAGAQIRRLWNWATGMVFGISFLIGAGLLLASRLFTLEIASPALLIVAVLLVPVYALGNLRAAALRGLGQVQIGQLPDVVLRPVFLLLPLSVTLLLGRPLDARTALLFHLGAALAALLAGIAMLLRYAPSTGTGPVEPLRHKMLLRSVLFLGLASSLNVGSQQFNTLLLGLLATPEEVGHFRVAMSLSALVATMLNVLNTVLQPRIAALYSKGDINSMKSLVTFSARLSFGVSAAVAILIALFGKNLIAVLFGAEFAAAYPVLLILILGQLSNSGFGPVALLLNMCGHERHTFRGILASFVVTVVLSVALVPAFGAIGGAIATAVALLTWNTLLNIKARALIGIDSTPLARHPKGRS